MMNSKRKTLGSCLEFRVYAGRETLNLKTA
jgi:hypothetical protein